MLFNAPEFVFLFLPITAAVYFLLNRLRLIQAAAAFVLCASIFFYGYWDPKYILLMFFSVSFNYVTGNALRRHYLAERHHSSKALLAFGIAINLLLLGYYKYTGFLVENVNRLFLFLHPDSQAPFSIPHIILPLAISFHTFQQIAYLVDRYRGDTHNYSFWRYGLFVVFFPQLIAGPIVHHREMIPQFDQLKRRFWNWNNASVALYLFSLGLFKKVLIADKLSVFVNQGYPNAETLSLLDGWVTTLCYTFQLYFDFSGYCDMATAAGLFLNIDISQNFNSPYKATDIQDFWRRWHMTLSRWLRDYLYIPLGGNRYGPARTYLNLFLTFLLGGIWHGAGWTFVIWGLMHGLGTSVQRYWSSCGRRLPDRAGRVVTFLFVHFTWVFFRATSLPEATSMLSAMFGFHGIVSRNLGNSLRYAAFLIPVALITFLAPNSFEQARKMAQERTTRQAIIRALFAGLLFGLYP
jgi:D-alanyl-lipoteichoic acid acyltransferase DltB (MBOAT superfamily)